MKKAIVTLTWVMTDPSSGPAVQKKIINVCTQLYPVILKWVGQKKSDSEVERCWSAFSVMKAKIVAMIEAENEGYVFKLSFYFIILAFEQWR